MPTDEKLEKLRERYRDKWHVYRAVLDTDKWYACRRGDLDISSVSARTLDALAEALAKLEGKCLTCGGQMTCVLCSILKAAGVTIDMEPGGKLVS